MTFTTTEMDDFQRNAAGDEDILVPIEGKKADAILYVIGREEEKIRNLKAQAQEQQDAIALWEEVSIRRHQGQIDQMTARLHMYMTAQIAADTKLKTKDFPNGILKVRKQQPLLTVDDRDNFFRNVGDRSELIRTVTKYEPDKKAIMTYIKKTGDVPDGCSLEHRDDKFSITTHTSEGKNG